MASPDVFLTSSPRARRQALNIGASSSPGLPSVQDILSQKPSRPPLLNAPFPKEATPTTVSACRPWRSLETEQSSGKAMEDIDTSFSVMEVPPESFKKGEKVRRRKKAGPARPKTPCEQTTSGDLPADQPWKKYKSPKRSAESAIDSRPLAEARLCPERSSDADKGDGSRYFIKPGEAQKQKVTRPSKKVTDEPLNLEAAMERRTEWTPPTQRVRIILDSDDTPPSDVNATRPSQVDDGQVDSFETVVASFKCETTQIQAGSNPADDGRGFPHKRRLLELIPTNTRTTSEPSKRQKAPKKKTRTLTDIATRAYRPATQRDIVADERRASTTATKDETGKGMTKARKRPSKASKKKEAPPKPILLSPEAALRQVAHQDFLFGTSSQLAREQSPLPRSHTTTKDLDMIDLRTPINSDAIEPAEQRPTLWDAGARDEDGDLFDVEVGLLADGPPELAEAVTEADPFGYVPVTVSLPSLINSDDARRESSVGLPDVVALRSGEPMTSAGYESVASGDDQGAALADGKPAAKRRRTATTTEGGKDEKYAQETRAEARYELFTDGQLAKQVAQYGFKPIKKRAAMIALLKRCNPGVGATLGGPSGSRSASTFEKKKKGGAGQSKAVSVSDDDDDDDDEGQKPIKGKRRRGQVKSGNAGDAVANKVVTKKRSQNRTGAAASIADDEAHTKEKKRRKSQSTAGIISDEELDWFLMPRRCRSRSKAGSDSDAESSEAAVDNKKRGRRKKKAVDEPPASAQRSRSPRRKQRSRSKRGAKESRRRSPREIADSQSDSSDGSSGSSSSSSRFDLGEDETMTSSLSPTEQQKELFAHISKAVTTAPRTTSPKQPSWHDKMLLYDPIVLEDLTAWLNSGQLTRVGCDEEASAAEVKAWCESKSICCVWRMSLHGKDLRGYMSLTYLCRLSRDAERLRASASVMVLSPRNEVLMVRRAPTSSSFASAHVFPGGQLDEFHDGAVPSPDAPGRHRDGPAYRLAAVRECFEETGVLLASGRGADAMRLSSPERDEARRAVQAGEVRFGTWLERIDAVADTDGLIPMTRWITPAAMPRRFTTQMYIYPMPEEDAMPVPTTDGADGENTAAEFWPVRSVLEAAAKGSITILPPQHYLLHRLASHGDKERHEPDDKVICPRPIGVLPDKRTVLALDAPGPELRGSGREGDRETVLVVEFAPGGPRVLEVRSRRDVTALL
ncbi:hypothetical protein L249_0488 [Ophiocordyceps polyrhachis-furcata BCC 54312]|uniref:Structure-specific endonuclease subunit SLX4 n=1 Tax=Ophiocordyceps polyrhachis-furcata BCC 54312 TaxID=1330021 RepID=A0A367LEW7_9HYPO|nr:hypothetical protein L249_0488 [Ophiocordyceps polyrhachis-furcata BCC 54312]